MNSESKPVEQDDPIVAEVREIRRQLLEKHGGIDGYLRHLREEALQRLQREAEEADRREAAELGKSA